MPQPNPSFWARNDNPAIITKQVVMRPVADSTTLIVNAASTNFTANQLPQTLAIAQGWHDDPLARVLTLVYTAAGAPAQGVTIRITGTDEFGQSQTEDVVITQAVAAARYYMTLNAFRTVQSVQLVAISGAAQGASTISVGVVALAATAGTVGATQSNGALATRFRGFAIPIPLSTGTGTDGASSSDFQSEIWGHGVQETAAAASVRVALDRGAGFLVDVAHGVMVPADAQVWVLTGDNAGADIRYLNLSFQTNRGE